MSDDKALIINGTDPLQRLTSFRQPRDLSLGSGKANKKVFAPNLNVTRNKNKSAAVTTGKPNLEKKDNRKERRNDKNRNIRNEPSIIKSSGVFSEGLGALERNSSRSSYGRDTTAALTLQKPTLRVKDIGKIDQDLEDQKIKLAINDVENSDEVEDHLHNTLHEKDAPIKLPMDEGYLSKPKPVVKIKQEVMVKQEPSDDTTEMLLEDKKPLVDVKEEVFEDCDVKNILTRETPTLLLLQLPDTLPGRGASTDYEAPRQIQVDSKPSTSTEEGKKEKPVDNRCRLSDLEEGRIGKFLIHKSGKVSLLLGDTKFEVCTGTKASFHQEVVSMGADDDSRSANMIALGPIQHKLNLMPDWESLFCDISL